LARVTITFEPSHLAPVPCMKAMIASGPCTHSGHGGMLNAASSLSRPTSALMS
jgi:hypothetical protein